MDDQSQRDQERRHMIFAMAVIGLYLIAGLYAYLSGLYGPDAFQLLERR